MYKTNIQIFAEMHIADVLLDRTERNEVKGNVREKLEEYTWCQVQSQQNAVLPGLVDI